MQDLFDHSLTYKKTVFRNIFSIKNSQNLFDDLSDDENDWNNAIELERKTHPSLKNHSSIQRGFDYSLNIDFFEYPFQNISATKFSDGSFGAWYGSETLETTIYETAYRYIKMMQDTEGFTESGSVTQPERRVGTVDCDGIAIDLSTKVNDYPWLIDPIDYKMTQEVGRKVHKEVSLLRVQSARCQEKNVVAFSPVPLNNPRDYCYLKYKADFKKDSFIAYRGNKIILSLAISDIVG
ncbi:RES domain protein (plasmid) [Piscirickettsia salmonis]|uniref:RES family NAD+ phosphorylase n=1 Tax=Piscirickettsia salmonis TaxID=1238 RepID=UPI0012B86794|nr:RES family NAD+ phosphorylase [Piscirickettsia salmonis]QGP52180.1 RES domain protein [Piscirickettsia salmonis]